MGFHSDMEVLIRGVAERSFKEAVEQCRNELKDKGVEGDVTINYLRPITDEMMIGSYCADITVDGRVFYNVYNRGGLHYEAVWVGS